ncbi:MAG: hypothetical protein ABIT37_05475, partial [Luteolibacter sp.]
LASGGRGGDVYMVTNLNDSGSGSLRDAVTNRDASVPRTVVFAVSGTIYLSSTLRITKGNLTIAGQTAPGDGICLATYPIDPSNSSNVVIRFLRSRLGDGAAVENDAFSCRYATDVIVDHCSFSWSIDEAATAYDNTRFTMQWCFVTESLRDSVHDKGAHGYGGIWGGLGATFHHNLLAHHDSRNSRFCGARFHGTDGEYCDMRNNVIYNWKGNTTYGGEPTDTGIPSHQNLINNYYKTGPATGTGSIRYRVLNPSANANSLSAPYGLFHVSGNYTTASSTVSADNWAGGVQGPTSAQLTAMRVNTPFDVAPVITQTAIGAYPLVLAYSGCRVPVRDSIDTRIANEVTNGTVTYYGSKNNYPGIIDSQTDVGGYPVLASTPAPADGDSDGMPDAWEIDHGLNPASAADRNATNADGYTNLELYLNGLVTAAFPIPQIGTQPVSQSVSFGAGFSLSVAATGPDSLFYQWFLRNNPISGATASSYSVVSSTTTDSGGYSVLVSNGYGGTRSSTASVVIISQPAIITDEPDTFSIEAGQAAALLVAASGTPPLAYQWYRGDRPIPGATAAMLDLGDVAFDEAGPYHVVVSNTYGSDTSATAWVTVTLTELTGQFSTNFGADTIHAASPVVSPTATNWYVMSSKDATTTGIGDDPATSGIVDPRLNLTMPKTSSGIIDIGAKFSTSPVTLEIGRALRLRAVVNTSNIRSLGIGLFKSGGTLPYTGMINSKLSNTLTDFVTGGTRNWDGYRFNLDSASGSGSLAIERRTAQTGTFNSSQALIAPGTSSSAPTVQALGSSSLPGFTWTDNATCTLTLSLKRNATDAYELTATVHAGTDTAAPALGSATTTTTGLAGEFDALAIGYRNRDNLTVSRVRITQVIVEKTSTAAAITNPYEAFLFNNGLDPVTDGPPGVDSDSDGVANPFEFILGGNPTIANTSILPSLTSDAGCRFRFLRHLDTSSAFNLAVESSAELLAWQPLANGVGGVTITAAPFTATHEQVEVSLPDPPAAVRFLRLLVKPKP